MLDEFSKKYFLNAKMTTMNIKKINCDFISHYVVMRNEKLRRKNYDFCLK